MDEQERRAALEKIAADVYTATGRDCYDALERLTRPPLNLTAFAALRLHAPPPSERGALARYHGGARTGGENDEHALPRQL